MTTQEAIEDLKTLKAFFNERSGAEPMCLDYAIDVLSRDCVGTYEYTIGTDEEGDWRATGGLFADDSRIKCSNCDFDIDDCVHGGSANIEVFKYCPNCGIKMFQPIIKRVDNIHSVEDLTNALQTLFEGSDNNADDN